MSLVSVATNRRISHNSWEYLRMAERQSSGPCTFSSSLTGLITDFSDPIRFVVRTGDPSFPFDSYEAPIRGDPNHGYPNPQTMTNVVRCRSHDICISDGLIWAFTLRSETWNVVSVQNSGEYAWEPSSRLDLLFQDNERLKLVKFLPNRANCERVVIHEYTLLDSDFPSLNRYLNATPQLTNNTVESNPVSSIGSESSTNQGNDQVEAARTTQGNPEHPFSSCKICLIEYGNRSISAIIPCGHVACSECIQKTLEMSNKTCSFCRGKVQKLLRLYEG